MSQRHSTAPHHVLILLLAGLALGTQLDCAQAANPSDGFTDAPMPIVPAEPRIAPVDNRYSRASAADFAHLAMLAQAQGDVRAIVGLQTAFTPEGYLDRRRIHQQRAVIAERGKRVIAALAGTRFSVLHTYAAVPALVLSLSVEALDALRASGLAATLGEDLLAFPTLAASTSRVEATEATVFNRTGQGQHVVIIDTGVDAGHPFLQQTSSGPSKVVDEACFSDLSCPDGSSQQIGPGAGAPCTGFADCDHGTHVAGIVAGKDTTGVGFNGVAREARIIAVRAFSNGGFRTSDIVAGLVYAYDLADSNPLTTVLTPLKIAAVNMSLGSSGVYTADCDTDPNWGVVKPAIDNLRAIGIPTVISSGNGFNNTGVSGPACISTAITVGGTNSLGAPSGEFVVPFSNSSLQVEILAPGAGINSSIPGAGFVSKSGTSMAAPHVAGAWAILKQMSPNAPVGTILSHLQATGNPVTDADNGVTTPRIRILAASVRLNDTGFVNANTFIGDGSLNLFSNGVGLATRSGGPITGAINIAGIPPGAAIVAAYLYWMTLGGPDASVSFQGQPVTGTLVGASQNTCYPVINPLGPNRVYRATLPTAAVPGNGSYTVSGVGGTDTIDGQGASLLIVYQHPPFIVDQDDLLSGRVIVLRHGAMTVNLTGQTMSHTFTGLSVPTPPTEVQLHVGFGDGDGGFFWEGPMLFAGASITAAGAFNGSDGPKWDDDTIAVANNLLPPGTASRVNSISLPANSASDCLAWAYAALSYRYPLDLTP